MILVSLFIPVGFFDSFLQIELYPIVKLIEVIELTYQAIFIKDCNNDFCEKVKIVFIRITVISRQMSIIHSIVVIKDYY